MSIGGRTIATFLLLPLQNPLSQLRCHTLRHPFSDSTGDERKHADNKWSEKANEGEPYVDICIPGVGDESGFGRLAGLEVVTEGDPADDIQAKEWT